MNHEFKIGDKVRYKEGNEFIGYVSGVHKGHLFLLEDFIIKIHTGNKIHIEAHASELELYNDK